ncbi:hypothetical protein MRB53_009526 [Persea americana]|uniref:Uncharacterized protein n=1 Tax=Persea americana TaxID=3435 RepID=A0ACC2LP95_PERAE|nr:hypothetical protein MRB53_009526 [Persea americana]
MSTASSENVPRVRVEKALTKVDLFLQFGAGSIALMDREQGADVLYEQAMRIGAAAVVSGPLSQYYRPHSRLSPRRRNLQATQSGSGLGLVGPHHNPSIRPASATANAMSFNHICPRTLNQAVMRELGKAAGHKASPSRSAT